jgi:deoxyribodipyrimidine photo-lyase
MHKLIAQHRAICLELAFQTRPRRKTENMIFVWHRADLRTHDHPALEFALHSIWGANGPGKRIVPVFVLDPRLLEMPYSGKSRIAFLHGNLRSLAESYRKLNSTLVVLYGHPEVELLRFARETEAKEIHAIASLEPVGIRRDARVRAVLEQNGVQLVLSRADTIQAPGSVLSGSGGPYRVFTPFYRTWLGLGLPMPTTTITRLEPRNLKPHGLESMPIPEPKASVPLPAAGEDAALAMLEKFVRDGGAHYEARRDLPALEGTSSLSPHFHLGSLSPRTAANAARAHTGWVRELAWRDFYRHILFEHPHLETQAFKPEWNDFPWRDSSHDLQAWTEGQTGYPIIDAGMRQLASTGWMHNRVRMIVASFLTKHLLIDWHEGERIFNDRLIDGDQASNNGGWQWATGCGVDAAPYFRVFNPVTQGEKFDPDAEYIKRFVPELEHLETKIAHQPWTASRQPAGYPRPIVDLKFGRDRFLETAKRHLKGGNDQPMFEF